MHNSSNKKSSILLIYTGGTIGMKEDPTAQALKPFDFSQILAEVPELRKFAYKIDSYTFSPLIDSSDVEPGIWVSLTNLIESKYDEYDGFVILHGTDTMSYTASVLSFMLEDLEKPVVLTVTGSGDDNTYEKIVNEEVLEVTEIAGSVGDGKSHLLSFMKSDRPDLMQHFDVHNDG